MRVGGLFRATASVNGRGAEVWACTPMKLRRNFGTGTVVEMHSRLDDFNVFFDMSGDGVVVASWSIKS